MTTRSNDKNQIEEDTKVALSITNLWAVIVTVFIAGISVAGFQLNTAAKIEQMNMENQAQHQQLMVKLETIDQRQQFYAIKRQVEDVILFVEKRRDQVDACTNKLVMNEIEFREQLRQFLR